jgi:hypothetical protein
MARRTSVHFTTGLLVTCGLAAAVACGSSSSSEFGNGDKDSGVGTLPGQGKDGGGDSGTISIIGTGGDSGTVPFTALAFDPPAATVTVSGSGAVTTNFTLKATLTAGGTEPVTPQSLAFDRPDLGSAANGDPVVVSAPSALGLYGGTGTLHAIYGGVEATATLTVVVHQVDYGTGVSATGPAVTAFNGGSADGGAGDGGGSGGAGTVGDGGIVELPTDPASGIAPLLYPYDATVFPLGITSPPVMFNAPQAGDVYWLHYVEKNYVFDGYYALAALPGNIRLPQDAWDRITASNGAAAGADPLAFTLSRWDSKTGKAYKSATASWTIAPASLQGAIYYWTTPNSNDSSGPAAVTRIPPGTGATPVPITAPDGKTCTGCHAVSADGTTLVAGVRGEPADDGNGDDRAWTSFDLPSGTVRKVSTRFSGNLAVSPDGKYVVSGINALNLCDSTTGAVIANTNLEKTPLDTNMTGLKDQAFAPSGKTLAAVEAGGDWQYWNFSITPTSELVTLGFDPVAVTFDQTPKKLLDSTSSKLPAGQTTIAYPSFSPDSSAIAFQAADHNSGCWGTNGGQCDTTTTESGSIFLVSTSGGDPVRLTNLTDPPVAADRNLALEPTFNPTARGGYHWLVFTSERNWGNEPDVQGTADNDKKRLWVSAVDPVLGTADPSHPAFFLEGQGTKTTNMRGFWTQAACIATPGDSGSSGATSDAGAADAGSGSTSDGGSPAACVNGFDCCSGFCNAGQCIGVSQVSCAGVGGSCKSSGDCCNSGSVSCINGSCTVGSIR